jgi:hypothetical protein
MLITKEQQEALVDKYVKEKHTADECIGFIDGINAILELAVRISTLKKTKITNLYVDKNRSV